MRRHRSFGKEIVAASKTLGGHRDHDLGESLLDFRIA
jgi:hypothetical protein